MQMDIKNIERTVNMLAGSLHMRMDYFTQINAGTKKLLIVEGQTDKQFICGHLCDDVICMVANKAFDTANGFSPKPLLNCKKAIVEVVYGLSVYPTIIKCPKGSENWKVFGMIDMDFDDVGNHTKIAKLFITDTHDLETLMLSTEKNLLQKIEGCVIGVEDTKKALFMAYQLGRIRQVLTGEMSKGLSAGNNEIEYSNFILEDYRISLKSLISYLNKQTEEPIAPEKEKKLLEQLSKDRSIKQYLTKEGIWKYEIDSFDAAKTNDLWDIVNGHDILSLLRYVNETAAIKFKASSQYAVDRTFEMALINAYNHNNFKGTKICKRMVAEGIVSKQFKKT